MKNHLSNELRELLRILIRDLGILEKSDASCCGISLAQCHAIVEIGRADKISLIDLADLLGLDKSTMSRTINNLVEAGLVLRELDMENRRYVIIQLTDKGKEIFQNTEESMNNYYQDILESISENKRNEVIEGLQLLTDAVKKNRCCEINPK